MSFPVPIEQIHRLGVGVPVDATAQAERVVDGYVRDFPHADDRSVAMDALLRDLARLRRRNPPLDGFITGVETYIDGLHRELTRRAA